MDLGPAYLAIYVALKYAAYVAWCWLGLRWLLEMTADSSLRCGLGWGLVRLLMGFGMGGVIAEVVTRLHLEGHGEDFGLYLKVYVPVRILEWGFMVALFNATWVIQNSTRKQKPSGARPRIHWGSTLSWVAGGVLISCVADIPVFMFIGGFPIGRFWC
jgi:hypothetical protein